MQKIIDIHGHLGNINFVPFWAADADKLAAYCREMQLNVFSKQLLL